MAYNPPITNQPRIEMVYSITLHRHVGMEMEGKNIKLQKFDFDPFMFDVWVGYPLIRF